MRRLYLLLLALFTATSLPAAPPDDPALAGAPEWREQLRGELRRVAGTLVSPRSSGGDELARALRRGLVALESDESEKVIAAAMEALALDSSRYEPYLLAAFAEASLGRFRRATTLVDSAVARGPHEPMLPWLRRMMGLEEEFWRDVDGVVTEMTAGNEAAAGMFAYRAWRRIPRRGALGILAAHIGMRRGAPWVDEVLVALDSAEDGTVRQLAARSRQLGLQPRDSALDAQLGREISRIYVALRLGGTWPASAVVKEPEVYLGEPPVAGRHAYGGELSLRAEYVPLGIFGNWTSYLSLGASASAIMWLGESGSAAAELTVPVHLMLGRDLTGLGDSTLGQSSASRSSVRPELRFWSGPIGLSFFAEHAFFGGEGRSTAVATASRTTTVAGAGVAFAVGGGPRRDWRVQVHGAVGFLGPTTSYDAGVSTAWRMLVLDVVHSSFTGRPYHLEWESPTSMVRISLGWRWLPFDE